MPNETGKAGDQFSPGEECGRCGARVEQGAELCAACGALLSAYRTPVVTADEVPLPEIGELSEHTGSGVGRSEPLPRTPFHLPVDSPPDAATARETKTEDVAELGDARTEVLVAMLEPERRLIAAMESEIATAPQSVPTVPATTPLKPSRNLPARTARSRKEVSTLHPANPPRKPGFVSIGSIEPVVMIGTGIFVIAVIIGLVSSAGVFPYGSVVALMLGTVGIFTIIIAMLVALVRKDQNRR